MQVPRKDMFGHTLPPEAVDRNRTTSAVSQSLMRVKRSRVLEAHLEVSIINTKLAFALPQTCPLTTLPEEDPLLQPATSTPSICRYPSASQTLTLSNCDTIGY